MARKKIREYHGKHILKEHIKKHSKLSFSAKVKPVLITKETIQTEWKKLKTQHPWLLEEKLVVKPDMLFGKRGKYGLVKVNANIDEVKEFVAERIDTPIKIGDVEGKLTHWIIEPFVQHEVEFYFSMESLREYTSIRFSPKGGIEVEENWDAIRTLNVPVGETVEQQPQEQLDQLLEGVPTNMRAATMTYITAMFALFEELDFVSVETNPFTLIQAEKGDEESAIDGWQPVPLDLCAEVDDTAQFKQTRNWGDLQFPDVWGNDKCPEEKIVEELDAKTGASLKLTVLRPAPEGRIWTLVAGGGASVIFADTVVDLGHADLLGNYGEYSGGPNAEQTYEYARTVLDLATRSPDQQGRVLLIGGGIANFTDVAKTFAGIVHALKEYREKLVACKFRIYVRRAGPNYEKGLRNMREVGKELGIPTFVYGPEKTMTEIIPMAIDYIKETTV